MSGTHMNARTREDDFDQDTMPHAPRTATVLVILAAFAVIISYLGVYAVTNALIASDVIPGWPREADPRPGWMVKSFLGLFTFFGIVGALFNMSSKRQFRRIDKMLDED
jgi:hypothetical protein